MKPYGRLPKDHKDHKRESMQNEHLSRSVTEIQLPAGRRNRDNRSQQTEDGAAFKYSSFARQALHSGSHQHLLQLQNHPNFPTASNSIQLKPHHCSSQHNILSVILIHKMALNGGLRAWAISPPPTLMSKFQLFRRFDLPHFPSRVFVVF